MPFEVYVVPSSEAFDGLLQDSWYWLIIDAESFVCEPAFDTENTAGSAVFDSCPFDVSLKFIQQAVGDILLLVLLWSYHPCTPRLEENTAHSSSVPL